MHTGSYIIDCPANPTLHNRKVKIVSFDERYGYFIQEKEVTWGILWKYLKEVKLDD